VRNTAKCGGFDWVSLTEARRRGDQGTAGAGRVVDEREGKKERRRERERERERERNR
jgi:hypothetical protein